MRLSDWLKANDRNLEWLAKEVGRHSSVMSRLAKGHIRGTVDVAAKIERLTDGDVTALDLENAFQEFMSPAPVAALRSLREERAA